MNFVQSLKRRFYREETRPHSSVLTISTQIPQQRVSNGRWGANDKPRSNLTYEQFRTGGGASIVAVSCKTCRVTYDMEAANDERVHALVCDRIARWQLQYAKTHRITAVNGGSDVASLVDTVVIEHADMSTLLIVSIFRRLPSYTMAVSIIARMHDANTQQRLVDWFNDWREHASCVHVDTLDGTLFMRTRSLTSASARHSVEVGIRARLATHINVDRVTATQKRYYSRDNDVARNQSVYGDGLAQMYAIFFRVRQVQELRIDTSSIHTTVASVPPYLAWPFESLRVLSFRDVDVPYLDDNVFDNMTDLHTLHIVGCNLHRVPDSLRWLVHLNVLSLTNNRLRELSGGLFDMMTRVRVLSVDHNEMERIDADVSRLHELEVLTASHNALVEFPFDALTCAKYLRRIDVSGNDRLVLSERDGETLDRSSSPRLLVNVAATTCTFDRVKSPRVSIITA